MKTIHDTKWIMKRAWKIYHVSKRYAAFYHKEECKTFSDSLKQAWREYKEEIKEDDSETLDFAMI